MTQLTQRFQTREKVLVVGGGIGGMRAALDLAESGKNVVLIDTSNAIGGLMTQLDRTFPTNNCDLCTLSPTMSEENRKRRIHLMPLTRLTGLEGQAGHFTATLVSEPRHIDMSLCTACGQCQRSFPERVNFNPGLDHRAPTCMRYPQLTPQAFSISGASDEEFKKLAHCCPAGAIRPDQTQQQTQMHVASVVLATGADIFDPAQLDYLAYGKDPDVVTSLEYERIVSASGPTKGELVRPSDGRAPKKVAWIQCVGSRGLQKGEASYCSSVCCMFALKEAIVTRERFGDDIETTIFYTDMRTFGKNYEDYLNRGREQYGVRLIRSRPHSIVRQPGDQGLRIAHCLGNESALQEELFDMVVLSTGFCIPKETREMADQLGIALNRHGFVETGQFNPVATSKEGIYVCGMLESPKDIAETMIQASAAACRAASHLPNAAAGSKDENQVYPPELDVSSEAPKVGIFICSCGENIGGLVDVKALAAQAAALPDVTLSEVLDHGCSREAMETIRQAIESRTINRVVIGGCSPRTHEIRFQETLRKAGLNKYLLEIANLRDQTTWVHHDHPAQAAEKAGLLIKAAVSAVKAARALEDQSLPINRDVLVVGGGVSGMTAALRLAGQGFKIYLAERMSVLGGVAALVHRTIEGGDIQAFVRELIQKTMEHKNIQVMTNAFIVDHSGMPGMFKTGLQAGPQMFYRQISHGAVIMATGAMPSRPGHYLLDEHAAVMTQLDADALLEEKPDTVSGWDNVVMVQCVGSRCEENTNCSRLCCQSAVKNALRIVQINPKARIFVLYRDMRTYGFYEDYYRQAREKGVIFIQYDKDTPPRAAASGAHVEITFTDPILARLVSVEADAVLLSTGFVNEDENTEDLAAIFNLARTTGGYLLEDHIKLRPADLAKPGFFVAGTAHAPKNIKESLAQAEAAAARVICLLAKEKINIGAAVAKVDSSKCAGCLICVRACPFDIPYINTDGYSQIDPARCHGCGVCASECPAKAIQLTRFEDNQILAKLNGLLERMVA